MKWTARARARLQAMARRKPRDWARIAEQAQAAAQTQLAVLNWTRRKDRVSWRWRKIVWPKPSRGAKERVAAAKKLAVSTKNRSGRYSEIERREAIARERADQQPLS